MPADIYLFGQILGTHSFLLRGGFLQPDAYSEIDAQYFLPGGETGTAATVLSSLGASVKLAGTHIGVAVAPLLKEFCRDKQVDLSALYFDPDDRGVMDYVVIAGLVRSPMGRFQTLFSDDRRWWNIPREEDIIGCQGMTAEEVFPLLQEASDDLTIITSGGSSMRYGRKGQPMKTMQPFHVEVRSTLGAGDTFKVGCTYWLLHGMTDDEPVRFASACSGIAISRFPLHPPTLEEVRALMQQQ